MSRAPAVDISATWSCASCPHKHAPTAPCPPSGAWLVLVFCSACDERTGRYCLRHHAGRGGAR